MSRAKSVTDALGRVAAEALLRSIALRIARSVRDSDLVARVGHAELAIVQHDVRSRENALSLAQRIRALLAEPIAIGDWEIAAAVSIGIALAPQGSETYTSWLIEAETAMTQARSCRAGTIMIFEEKMRGDPEIVPRRTVALA